MSKPKWEDAPEWAMYLAMDADGEWFWFKTKPKIDTGDDLWWGGAKFEHAGISPFRWDESLERRP